MRRIVRTRSGKIFCIAAEIAAANKKSTVRPVGHVLVPGTTKKVDEVKGGIDRKMSDCRSGEYMDSPEEMEDESEEEGGEGEEWLGKEEGFVSTLSELFSSLHTLARISRHVCGGGVKTRVLLLQHTTRPKDPSYERMLTLKCCSGSSHLRRETL